MIHDLEELFALLKEHGEAVPEQFLSLIDLTDFAVQFRYESFNDFGGELDRIKVINQATKIIEYVKKCIDKPFPNTGNDQCH